VIARRRTGATVMAVVILFALTTPVRADEAPLCDGIPATIWGTPQADHLVGTPGPDVIAGLGSGDTIIGYGGDDVLCGDGGDDILLAGDGADAVFGGRGDDIIRGSLGNDLLYGGGGDDDLRGQGGDDRLLGGTGDDLLLGGVGSDVLLGSGGRDELIGGPGSDALDGGSAADTLAGNGGTDFLLGGDRNDRIRGGSGDDVLVGGPGKNLGAGGLGTDFCSDLFIPNSCEVVEPGLWNWVRSTPAAELADRLRDLVTLQTGCASPLDLDWAGVAAAAFPEPGRTPLTGAVDDLQVSADACNRDSVVWRNSLRDALVHLEEFNVLVAGGFPQPVGLIATAADAAPTAIDVAQATSGYLNGGNPPLAESDFWWRLVHPGHARLLEMAVPDGGYDVLLVGSSTMVSAGVPSLFTDLDGRTAYNAALPGSGPEIQATWLEDQAVDLADPDLVIIGVEDRAFRQFSVIPGSCAEPTDSWDAARSLRGQAFEPVAELAASSEGALFFGDPASPDPTRPLAIHDYFVSNHGPLGNRNVFPPSLTPEQKQAAVGSILSWSVGFQPCSERIDNLGILVAALDGEGIKVVVVAMPTSDIRAGGFDPEGGGDPVEGRIVIDGLLAQVATAAIDAGAAFVDLSDHPLLPEERFRDIAHVDQEGAAIFTTLLVAALATLP